MTRVIIITGKGGVGKSSVAAATALTAARRGVRTAILSVDSAHNLSDIFARRIHSEPTPIADNLKGLEVDLNYETRTNWAGIVNFFRQLTLNNSRINEIVAEECAVFPGMEELFGLLRLHALIESKEFDLVVVDAPPTSDMLKFLRLPDVLEWYLLKFLPLEKTLFRTARPLANRLNIVLPDDSSLDNLTDWHDKVGRLGRYLMDYRNVSARVVMTPDRVCLEESRRTFATLSLFGLMVDAIIVNKLFPAHEAGSFMCFWARQQHQMLGQVEGSFAPIPILTSELLTQEIVGPEPLENFGWRLYKEIPPEAMLMDEPPLKLNETKSTYDLCLKIPFLDKDNFRLWLTHDSVIINLHNQRRQIPLPDSLLRREMIGSTYENQTLCISFRRDSAGKP
ncbi:MAG: ArsA family ATPase [Armatimonadetes bacterium]|nr:ArsA family ATPase [Armatimonadota bacterium]